MARPKPPIIISSGSGVASALTKGLIPARAGENSDGSDREVLRIVRRNLADLNARVSRTHSNFADRPVTMSLKRGATAKIYWRLRSDPKDGWESGKHAH